MRTVDENGKTHSNNSLEAMEAMSYTLMKERYHEDGYPNDWGEDGYPKNWGEQEDYLEICYLRLPDIGYVPTCFFGIAMDLDLTRVHYDIMYLVFSKTLLQDNIGDIYMEPAEISIAEFVDYLDRLTPKQVIKAKQKLTKSGLLVVVKRSDGVNKTLYEYNLDFDKQ